jgi:signal transduction histidine kinase
LGQETARHHERIPSFGREATRRPGRPHRRHHLHPRGPGAEGAPEREAGTALAEGRAFDERWHLRKDGSRFRGSGVAMPMHDAHGATVGLVKIFRDQTAERYAGQALEDSRCELRDALLETERARDQAQAAGRAKDHFLAVLSHELRTPLTPVLAVISGLQGDGRLPDDVRGQLAMMRRNVELEARLIDDMLDLTRIARGKLELRREVADLKAVIHHALQTANGELVEKRQRLVLDLAPCDHTVWADTPRLTQVFWNLFSNAVKFTPPEGTIAVRSRCEPGVGLTVEVADTGIGIESEVLADIFDAFQQGTQTITRRFGGLGLGLAISKAIVELHGGSLTATSEGKGQGALFCVRLPTSNLVGRPATPAVAETPPAAAKAAEPPPPPGAALHILLVEDHVDTAEAMADLLRDLGYEVTVAGTVAAGLAAAARLNGGIDLVLSDLGLPDGTGLELMAELHGRYGVKGIALSGYGMEEDVRRSLEAGFERHLTKPINLQALQTAIQETTSRG